MKNNEASSSNWSDISHEVMNSELSVEEKLAELTHRMNEYIEMNNIDIGEKQKKTLSEEYDDVLKEMAERDGVTAAAKREGMATVLQYGDDVVHVTDKATGGSLVGERGPIYVERFVTEEDAQKAWFREAWGKIGNEIKIYPSNPPADT
ncbi:MAG: hypothetical protein LBQ02_03735 [Candidatus Nomurabacteria bacterium]|jgi:hypothetical protein|nr:hypothetical protein [Candidatus Nomurabacteria bacterium]